MGIKGKLPQISDFSVKNLDQDQLNKQSAKVIEAPFNYGRQVDIPANVGLRYTLEHNLGYVPTGLLSLGGPTAFLENATERSCDVLLSGARVLVQYQKLTSQSDSMDFTGLNGDRDGIYELEWLALKPASSVTLYLNPGVVTAGNLRSTYLRNATTTSVTSNWAFTSTPSNETRHHGHAIIFAASGRERRIQGYGESRIHAGTAATFQFSGELDDSSTTITSLKLQASTTNQYLADSEAWLYKRPINYPKLKYWIF